MKNRYQTIKQLNGNFNVLVGLGIIPIQIHDWINIYEFFLIERKTEKKMQSYENTAENFKISTRHVMNVIRWMECD
jgi:hypothetical protein